jgi:ribonuclease BN (tRNA processing enzyme)
VIAYFLGADSALPWVEGTDIMQSRSAASLIHVLSALLLLSYAPAFSQGAKSNAAQAAGLSLLVLGSGGPGATGRAGAGYIVSLQGRPRILVDAGPGTFARAGEAGVDLGPVDIVLLTHLHVDHTGELPGLIKARIVSERRDLRFKIFGPPGSPGGGDAARFPSTTQFVDLLFGPRGAFSYLTDFAGHMTLDARNVARSAQPQVLLQDGDLTITGITGHHGDAPSVIYRIDYRGRSITFSGDIDAAGHAALTRLARNTDVLVFNAAVLDPPGSPPVLYTLHTAPRDIGRIAQTAGARKLLLSHLNPTIDDARAAVLASIRESYRGSIEFARDGSSYAP